MVSVERWTYLLYISPQCYGAELRTPFVAARPSGQAEEPPWQWRNLCKPVFCGESAAAVFELAAKFSRIFLSWSSRCYKQQASSFSLLLPKA
mmetsp:Transcript_4894/g.10811  ORF Transcript_4894/g.10811 Transcript_4894/m.10811 type:complete len:92 (-) Transcript_4894:114-389(-)